MCDDYKDRKMFYSEKECCDWLEFKEKILMELGTKMSHQKEMAVNWLRPLKGLSTGH